MPEMFYTGEAISSDPELSKSIALITDGRFSGASKGPNSLIIFFIIYPFIFPPFIGDVANFV